MKNKGFERFFNPSKSTQRAINDPKPSRDVLIYDPFAAGERNMRGKPIGVPFRGSVRELIKSGKVV